MRPIRVNFCSRKNFLRTGGRTSLNNCGAHLCAFGAHLHRRRWKFLGSFLLRTAMRTDVCAPQCAPTSVRILTALIYNFIPIIQFLIDLFPHRCSPPFHYLRMRNAHWMRTACAPNAHRHSIRCACSPTSQPAVCVQ